MNSQHVLVISYYWPPAGGPGVQRWVKMCNHLIKADYKVTVITVRNGSYPALDKSLEAELDSKIKVIRTKTIEPFRVFNLLQGKKGKSSSVGLIGLDAKASVFKRMAIWIRANWMVPDARKYWTGFAKKAISQLLEQQSISHIITTGPPHSTHAIGLFFKKKKDIDWIADLRDPWVNIHYHDLFPLSPKTIAKHQALENKVLSTADHVTVVSPGMKREFQDRAENISVIYNGYDESDFEVEPDSDDKFSIRYIGNLKPNQEVEAFNRSLITCSEEIEGFSDNSRIQLIGNKDPGLLHRMKEGLSKGMVQDCPAIPHHKAVAKMKGADVLLFIIPKAKNNKLIITGKLFEYLASNKPLLSIGPVDGDAAEILQDAGRSKMIDYEDKVAITEAIKSHYLKWNEKKVSESEFKKVDQFSRRMQTDHLIQILRTTSKR